MRQSIFAFLKGTLYENCYEYLEKFEKKFLLDPEETGKSLRMFWEEFTNTVIDQHRLRMDYQKSLEENGDRTKQDTLAERLYFLRTKRILKSFEIDCTYTYIDKYRTEQKASRFLANHKLPEGKKLYILDFFRQYANQFHHVDEIRMDRSAPKYDVNFHQTWDYISLMQEYLLKFLGKTTNERVSLRQLPLSSSNGQTRFYMETERKIGFDPAQLHCLYTYSGRMYPDDAEDESYFAIIQLFDKDTEDELQLKRSAKTYNNARRSDFGEALREIKVISGVQGAAEFYILSYVFEEPAQQLTSTLLKKINMRDRLLLCREIANIMSKLHKATPAIHHRFLTHQSIYVCENFKPDTPWYPAVIGFSLAKIDQQDQATVLDGDIKNRITKLIPKDLMPYIPLEWEDTVNQNGDRVDVYSMGILFYHILTGNIRSNIQVSVETPICDYFPLIRESLSAELSDVAELIIRMLSPMGAKRPSAREVYNTLDQICRERE